MANITVSASSNFDTSGNLGLANGESVTINTGAILTINSDNRWSQNAACPLNITIDAASGGELLLDGRDVWWVPFDAATGNVPALGTVGTPDVTRSGSSVGEFLGIFTALGVAPSAAAGAMPSSGFIKLRTKSATLADNGVLTFAGGATATLSGAGQRGWLNIVGVEAGTITIPRLGTMRTRGDWFDLGVTSGSTGQTLQYYVADYCPALWIETSAGSGVYEKWLCAGDRWSATYASQDERGKLFGCTSGGAISLATATYGKLPAVGCKIRVPNVHISSTTSANYALNTLNATASSRWEINAASGGVLDIENIASAGFFWNAARAYSLVMNGVSYLHQLAITEIATPVSITNIGAGIVGTLDTPSIYIDGLSKGGVIGDAYLAKYTPGTGQPVITGAGTTAWKNLTIENSRLIAFARSSAAGQCIAVGSNSSGLLFENNTVIGGGVLFASACADNTVKNLYYSDSTIGSTITAAAISAVTANLNNDAIIDGVYLMPDGTPPYAYPAALTGLRNRVRNIGTLATRFDCGSMSIGAFSGSGQDNKYQRIYVENTRTRAFTLDALPGNLVEHVWADAADSASTTMGGTIIKGGYFWSGGVPTALNGLYGVVFYDAFYSNTQGRVGVFFTEPDSLSAPFVSVTGAVFNGASAALLKASGDELIYTWPHFILGYTSLANVAPTVTGTSTGNLTFEYDLDKGSGFSGTWQTANATNLSAETGISATAGFKPKFRIAVATPNAANAITGFHIHGATDATSQQTQYPLDTAHVSVIDLVTGSRVKASRVDNGAILFNGAESGGAITFSTDYIGPIEVEARKASSAPYYRPWASRLTTVSGATVSATAIQILD